MKKKPYWACTLCGHVVPVERRPRRTHIECAAPKVPARRGPKPAQVVVRDGRVRLPNGTWTVPGGRRAKISPTRAAWGAAFDYGRWHARHLAAWAGITVGAAAQRARPLTHASTVVRDPEPRALARPILKALGGKWFRVLREDE